MRLRSSDSTPGKRLRVGVILPDTEWEMGGDTPRWSDISVMALAAEGAGFDSVWVFDHLLYRFSGKPDQGAWECWSNLAALAAITEQVDIGPVVCCTGYRNPALLAKMAETVDEISGGRLILGLGAGWLESDYTAFGYPYDYRVSRFEEAVEIIHGLLHTGHVDFSGRFYSARDCELRPRGPRPNGLPIMIGSSAPRMLQVLARFGDSWNAWAVQSLAELEEHRQKVDAAMELAGRDPATIERSVTLLVDTPDATGRPSEDKPGLKARTPEELAEFMLAYAEAGVAEIQIMLDPNTMKGIEWSARALEHLEL
ncbi:LLM class F420-dependent oxidoreductase [soil metagenome]